MCWLVGEPLTHIQIISCTTNTNIEYQGVYIKSKCRLRVSPMYLFWCTSSSGNIYPCSCVVLKNASLLNISTDKAFYIYTPLWLAAQMPTKWPVSPELFKWTLHYLLCQATHSDIYQSTYHTRESTVHAVKPECTFFNIVSVYIFLISKSLCTFTVLLRSSEHFTANTILKATSINNFIT